MNVNHYFKKIVLGLGIALMVGAGFFLFSQKTVAQNEAVCTIKNAIFDPYTPTNTSLENFFKEDSPQLVKFIITTENCKDKEVTVVLLEAGTDTVLIKNRSGNQKIPGKFTVPDSEKFEISTISGEARCNTTASIDCEYSLRVYYGSLSDIKSEYNSEGKLYGELNYDCEVLCNNDWVYVSDTSKKDNSAVELEDGQILGSASEACAGQGEDCYELYGGLADAFGNKITTISTANNDSLGGFLNMIIVFATGIAGIIVVARIFYLGIKFMAVRKESNALKLGDVKAEILKTLLGLVLLLGVYVILRTINPDLLNLTPRIDTVNLAVESTVDNQDPTQNTVGDRSVSNRGIGFNMVGTFENPTPSQNSVKLLQAKNELAGGASITKLVVDVGSGSNTNGRMYIHLSNGTIASVPIRTGQNGVAEKGRGVTGDRKTPKGTFTIGGSTGGGNARIALSKDAKNAIFTRDGKTNLGPAFLGINIDPTGANRGIGIHGQGSTKFSPTYGCIRMHNDDLVIIGKYIKSGTPIIIE
jgi:hypothetical protein